MPIYILPIVWPIELPIELPIDLLIELLDSAPPTALSVFLEKHINTQFSHNCALLFFQTPFSQKKKRRRPHTCLTTGVCFQAQDSCACTRFLCMHNTLVHAQHSCACTGGARDQGRDPKQISRPGPDPRLFFCWVLALVPPVHAQECCECTRTLCMHKNLV